MHINMTNKQCTHIIKSGALFIYEFCYIPQTGSAHFVCALLMDAIETCGGSGRLIKLLNRLGICTSVDSYVQ